MTSASASSTSRGTSMSSSPPHSLLTSNLRRLVLARGAGSKTSRADASRSFPCCSSSSSPLPSKDYVKRHTQSLLYDALFQARILEIVRLEVIILVRRHNEQQLRSLE